MKSVLIVYFSRGGHTARIARELGQTILAEGNRADVMDVVEADHEGVNWDKYDLVIVGSAVHYGRYNRRLMNFVKTHQSQLSVKAHSFFNVTGIARNAKAAQPEGNPYMQKFLKTSAWKPQHVKCFAGNVDYPHYNWFDRRVIQLIMRISGGPTNLHVSTDFTNWDEVRTYARYCLSLA